MWRLVYDVLVESQMVKDLVDLGFTKDLSIDVGKIFNGT